MHSYHTQPGAEVPKLGVLFRGLHFLCAARAVFYGSPEAAAKLIVKAVNRGVLYMLVALLTSDVAVAQDEWVPDGFEELMGAQDLIVDIYFGGRRVGSFEASIDLETLTFLDGASVFGALPPLKEAAQAQVKALLLQPLAIHGDKVCPPAPTPGCGYIDSEGLDIIYDASQFRVDIFIAPSWLAVQRLDKNDILPRPELGPGAMLNIRGAYQVAEVQEGSVTTQLAAAADKYHLELRSVTDIQNRRSLTLLERANVSRYEPLHAYQAGVLQPFGPQLALMPISLAAAFSNTSPRRLGLRTSNALPVVVFLRTRGVVRLIREGVVLHAQTLPAGQHEINTQRLPDGVYGLTVSVTDASGTRERTELFVKTRTLPPLDETLYWANLGVPFDAERWFVDQSRWYTHAGAQKRLSEQFALEAHGIGALSFGALEVDARWLLNSVQVGGGVFGASTGAWGVWGDGIWLATPWSVSLGTNLRQGTSIWSGAYEDAGFVLARADWSRGEHSIGLQGAYRWGEQGQSWSIAPRHRWSLIRTAKLSVQLDTTIDISSDDTVGWLVLRGTTEQQAWRADGYGGGVWSSAERGLRAGAQGRWKNDQVAATVRADAEPALTLGADVIHSTAVSHLDGSVNHRDGATSATANAGVTLVAGADHIGLGDPDGAMSSVAISLVGKEDIEEIQDYELIMDGRTIATMHPGDRVSLNLAPFQTYVFSVRSVDALAIIEPYNEELTLYPGSVATVQFEVKREIVMLGRVTDAAGEPWIHAEIRSGQRTIQSDDIGYFQLNILEGDPLHIQSKDGQICELPADGLPAIEGGLIIADPLICP